MKQRLYLINKETGYVITCKDKNEYWTVLQFLHDDWKPCKIDIDRNEPLIENDRVRFSLKMWAHINNIHSVIYRLYKGNNYCCSYFANDSFPIIKCGFNKELYELKDGVQYTITELCGK